jgi:hypothetical protein
MSRAQRQGESLRYFFVPKPCDDRDSGRLHKRARWGAKDAKLASADPDWEKQKVKGLRSRAYFYGNVIKFLDANLGRPRNEVLGKIRIMRPRRDAQEIFDHYIRPAVLREGAILIQADGWFAKGCYYFCPVRGTLQNMSAASPLTWHDILESLGRP